MKFLAGNRLTCLLCVVCFALLVLSGWIYWNYGMLKIQVAFASEQTKIFDEMRQKALQSDPTEATGFLAYAAYYYPSGTKQDTGSRLDRIVERDRALAVRDIIAYLRTKTGEDLGTGPEPWIQKYAKK